MLRQLTHSEGKGQVREDSPQVRLQLSTERLEGVRWRWDREGGT